MLPGSQSQKIAEATEELAGDPRFRLHSTLARGGKTFVIAMVATTVVAWLLIFLANGALAGAERIEAAAICEIKTRGAMDADHKELDANRARDALKCLEELEPIEIQPDEAIAQMKSSLSAALAAHDANNTKAQEAALLEVAAGADLLNSWIDTDR